MQRRVLDNISFFTHILDTMKENYDLVQPGLVELNNYLGNKDARMEFSQFRWVQSFDCFCSCSIKCHYNWFEVEFSTVSEVSGYGQSFSIVVEGVGIFKMPGYSTCSGSYLKRKKHSSDDSVLKIRDELIPLINSIDNDDLESWEFQLLTQYDIGTVNALLLMEYLNATFDDDTVSISFNLVQGSTPQQRQDIIEMFNVTVQGLIYEASKVRSVTKECIEVA